MGHTPRTTHKTPSKRATTRNKIGHDAPTYLDLLRLFAATSVLVNKRGENFLAKDESVILQIEVELDTMGKWDEESVHVSFWEVDGDELMFALPGGDNSLAQGVEEALGTLLPPPPKELENGLPPMGKNFLMHYSLCAAAETWLEEQVYPIVRDRVFPIPRSLGISLLLSDATGDSLDIWQNDDRPFSDSVLNAVRSTLHTPAIH